MSKHTVAREIERELERINDRIDRAIIRGRSYTGEARRHRELLATLSHLVHEEVPVARTARPVRHSPVRRSLTGGVFSRLLGIGVAA